MFPVQLTGPRLFLRELTVADAEDLLVIATDPRIAGAVLDTKPPNLEIMRRVRRERGEAARQDDRTIYELGVMLADKLIGTCGLTDLSLAHQRAELGYVIHPDFAGNGYATEAAKLLIEFGFTELGLHRIEASTAPGNAGSQRVLEKAGMSYEGCARDQLLVRGEWRDSLRYAILATDTR